MATMFMLCVRERRTKLPTEYVDEDGVRFLRVRTGNITKCNVFEKGITTLTIEHLFIRAIKKYLADVKFKLIIYSTPPITFEGVVRYIKNRDNARSYLLLKDIFLRTLLILACLARGAFCTGTSDKRKTPVPKSRLHWVHVSSKRGLCIKAQSRAFC